MTTTAEATLSTNGMVIHRPYDLLVWALTLGRERAFREKQVDLAGLKSGDSVLDVGCGTGALAMAAKQRVGASGKVHGIDASPEMIARARKKANKRGSDVGFRTAVVEELPFPDETFDAVLSTLMLHHLPADARRQCVFEIRRVLRPSGRVLFIDFEGHAHERRGLMGRRHGHADFNLQDVIPVLKEAGMSEVESGPMKVLGLHFVRAAVPSTA